MTAPDVATRDELRRIATHVLARRRSDVTGRFGLRATPGGIGTPAFGPDDAVEVVRTAGGLLVHEVGGAVRTRSMVGSSLQDLADLVGVDLARPLDVGHDTPALGDVRAPLELDLDVVRALADWFDVGWRALDAVAGPIDGAATVQLWPEHFDAGTSVPVGPGPDDRVNLGASAGDAAHPEPYLYIGPWGSERPGDPGFWNAPFGAVLAAEVVTSPGDAVRFFQRGLDLLRSNRAAT